jgi:2-iminobutanoate/2-iminopropanoate deaminase
MTGQLRWLTVTVPDDGTSDLQAGVPALNQALTAAGLVSSDVVHLKLWVGQSVDEDKVAATWTRIFPAREHRPSLSLVRSRLADGAGMMITVAALPGAVVRSSYEPDQSEDSFARASVAGDHLFVAALKPACSDAGAQAQAQEVFDRLDGLLRAVGTGPAGLGHMFVWYSDHSVRDVINEPFVRMFGTPGDRPCRHSVVRELPPGVALMIEAAGSVSAVRSCYTIGGLWHGGIGGVPNSLPFGTRCGELLFSAGTYGRDPANGEIPDGFADQAKWALHYSHEFLRVAGMTAANVGQVFVWVRDAEDAAQARKAVESGLAADGSTTSIQVIEAALPGTNRIQIELVAQAVSGTDRPPDALS